MKYLFLILILISSCNSNYNARYFGGNYEITLPKNEIFINLTWKESSLWVISKDTITGYYFAREKSPFGELEGQVTIKPANAVDSLYWKRNY
jgi:hypothetical protein